jgi:hypothetical protein
MAAVAERVAVDPEITTEGCCFFDNPHVARHKPVPLFTAKPL